MQISMAVSYKLILWYLMSSQAFAKFPSFQWIYNISKKKLEIKLIFWMQIKIKVSQVDFNTLDIKFPTRWYCHYWWVWLSILEVLKGTSLQYLYNISKKKLRMEFIFCMQINIKVSTSWHYCSWWNWPDMSKGPKIGSWGYFCNILRKYCCSCFCVLLLCKTFRYFTRVQSCLVLLVSTSIPPVGNWCRNLVYIMKELYFVVNERDMQRIWLIS